MWEAYARMPLVSNAQQARGDTCSLTPRTTDSKDRTENPMGPSSLQCSKAASPPCTRLVTRKAGPFRDREGTNGTQVHPSSVGRCPAEAAATRGRALTMLAATKATTIVRTLPSLWLLVLQPIRTRTPRDGHIWRLQSRDLT